MLYASMRLTEEALPSVKRWKSGLIRRSDAGLGGLSSKWTISGPLAPRDHSTSISTEWTYSFPCLMAHGSLFSQCHRCQSPRKQHRQSGAVLATPKIKTNTLGILLHNTSLEPRTRNLRG